MHAVLPSLLALMTAASGLLDFLVISRHQVFRLVARAASFACGVKNSYCFFSFRKIIIVCKWIELHLNYLPCTKNTWKMQREGRE